MNNFVVNTQVKIPGVKRSFKSVEAAEAYVSGLKNAALIEAWMDHRGMIVGKTGRRASTAVTVSQFMADTDSGVIAKLMAEVQAKAAEAAVQPESAADKTDPDEA